MIASTGSMVDTLLTSSEVFCSFKYFVVGRLESSFRILRNLVDTIDHIEKFFAEKPEKFWKGGIFKLRER